MPHHQGNLRRWSRSLVLGVQLPRTTRHASDSRLAHKRIVRSAVRNVATSGTRLRIMSVTRGPGQSATDGEESFRNTNRSNFAATRRRRRGGSRPSRCQVCRPPEQSVTFILRSWIRSAYLGKVDASKQQIDLDARDHSLHDWHEGRRNRLHVSIPNTCRHVPRSQ